MAERAAGNRDANPQASSADAELVSLLGLAASQIEVALREAEAPVAELAGIVQALGAGGAGANAATALQFHDRLSQRLTHVRDTLASLAKFLDARSHHGPGSNWDRLRADIRDQYSMEQERLMFDLLVGGATPEQVLEALAEMRTSGAASHVDLF
ncbi:MAG TPA: hypothetical protein VMT92_04770 [Steroidobacteraceae bacterium]|nr:hypothetical protein [Steroidobacteraceae bacterium]